MKVSGLDSALRALDFDENTILKLLDDTANDIAQQAISNVNDSLVGATINVQKIDGGYTVNIGSDFDMSAFIEFGTGNYVILEPEYTSEYARQWYVNGKGTLRPAPFLMPAYRVGVNRFLVELDKELKRQFG